MTEDQEEKTVDQESEGEPEARQEAAPPTHPPQIVEIKTPLDKPEFDWFLETFMQRMGLSDRKQSAIMLTKMMYDMGLDPYSDLKDLQGAMEEMNNMLKNMPNTPTALKVKDTMGAMYAAKAGRTMLERFPRAGGQDPMMDKMERIMDKYMPMILGMRMVSDVMKAEPGQQQKTTAQTELPEAVRTEIAELKHSVANMTELLSKQRAQDEQKEFASSVIESVNAKIIPMIQALQGQVDGLARQPPPPAPSSGTDEMREISNSLKEAVDKLGEKAGQKNLTLADVEPLLNLIENVEKRLKKEPTSELDWKTATVSTLGETLKEAVTAYREVETAKAGAAGGSPQLQAPQNTEMQTIIRKQVQNYILQRLQTGSVTMNIQEAAQSLGLSPEQVKWAYQTLMAEGWINVRIPRGEQKDQGASDQNVGTPEEPGQTKTDQPFVVEN